MKQLCEMATVKDDSFVWDVTDGRVEDALRFGGKASGLAKMARAGIPIPPAFVELKASINFARMEGRLVRSYFRRFTMRSAI
jgi:hypothetical protein